MNSVGYQYGGAFHYLEESTTLTSQISITQDVSATIGDMTTFEKCKAYSNTASGGALFYANVKKKLILTINNVMATE